MKSFKFSIELISGAENDYAEVICENGNIGHNDANMSILNPTCINQ